MGILEPVQPLLIDSCHSTWIFDPDRMRFRRALKVMVDHEPTLTAWRPFFALDLDPGTDAFTVWLDPERTRVLRSWRHRPGRCANCDPSTFELSLEQIARAVEVDEARLDPVH